MKAPAIKIDTRQVAAVALTAVLAVIAVVWITWATLAAGTVSDRIVEQDSLLHHLEERLAALEGRSDTGGGPDGPSVYFPGETPAIAAAVVQRTVDSIVDSAGGRVIESQLVPVQEGDPDGHRIDLRTSFEATIDSLQEALFEVETQYPIMLIRSMSVRSFVSVGRDDADEDDPLLQVSLVVSGFWEQPEP